MKCWLTILQKSEIFYVLEGQPVGSDNELLGRFEIFRLKLDTAGQFDVWHTLRLKNSFAGLKVNTTTQIWTSLPFQYL